MPQRDVLEPGLRVGAQQPRDARDALRDDRVPLMRHRRRALLGARPERLLDLAYLGALEVPDLGGEALEPGTGERHRGQELRVAVAAGEPGGGGIPPPAPGPQPP